MVEVNTPVLIRNAAPARRRSGDEARVEAAHRKLSVVSNIFRTFCFHATSAPWV